MSELMSATWTTPDLLVGMTLTALLGVAVGYALPRFWPWIRNAWANWQLQRDRRDLEHALAHAYDLAPAQVQTASVAHRRWAEGRCVFCGVQKPEALSARCCEAQTSYVEGTGRQTWEEDRFMAVLDHIFGANRDLEATG